MQSSRAQLFLNGQEIANDDPRLPNDWYSTDLWTDFGIKFIDEAPRRRSRSSSTCAAQRAALPLAGAPGGHREVSRQVPGRLGQAPRGTLRRQNQLGLIDPAWAMSPRPAAVAAWDTLPAEEQDRFDHIMAIYAACVWRMDKSVGVLVDALQQRGVLDNTLILFMSDNGGNAESGPRGRLKGEDPGGPGSTVFCGQSWATLENTPFRRYKHFNHEGGIATPLIVHWPNGIAAKGELRTQPGHLVDIMATVVDVGARPIRENSRQHDPADGRASSSPRSPTSRSNATRCTGSTKATPPCASAIGNSSARAATARGNCTT